MVQSSNTSMHDCIQGTAWSASDICLRLYMIIVRKNSGRKVIMVKIKHGTIFDRFFESDAER